MMEFIAICIFLLIALLLFSALHSFITHIILFYEMRLNTLHHENKNDIHHVLLILKSFLVECFCNFIRFFLLPFAHLNFKTATKIKDSPPILLIHGYMQNQTDWLWFRHKLQKIKDLGPIYSLNLLPPFASIKEHAACLQNKIAAIQQENNNQKVILIGHSMGGLVASYYNEYLSKGSDVMMVIALASPYQGTKLAALGYGTNIKEMYPNSNFLQDLSEQIKHSKTPYYFIASKIDNVILPWQSSIPHNHNDRADCVLILEDHGHLRFLISIKVITQIESWIKKEITTSQNL